MKFTVLEQTRVMIKEPAPWGSTVVGFAFLGFVIARSHRDALEKAKDMFPKLCRRIAVEGAYDTKTILRNVEEASSADRTFNRSLLS